MKRHSAVMIYWSVDKKGVCVRGGMNWPDLTFPLRRPILRTRSGINAKKKNRQKRDLSGSKEMSLSKKLWGLSSSESLPLSSFVHVKINVNKHASERLPVII